MTESHSQNEPGLPAKSLHDLEWQRILDAVASRCIGPLAARLVVPLASTRQGTQTALRETAEALWLLENGEALPLAEISELREALGRVSRGGALEAPILRDVMKTLGAARRARRFLASRRENLGRLEDACAFDPTLDHLRDEIADCIEADGTLADHASPMLRTLRGECANLRGRIVRRLESMLYKHANILQDNFHTIREGRHVLPVRRDAHERLPGIVHGTSASGATVFVEPRALVTQGNRLRMAQSEQEREEIRILEDLTELVRERLPTLIAALDSLDHLDLRQASARLGQHLNGVILKLAPTSTVFLKEARHPGLLLDGVEVVPSDLSVQSGQALVISGPNAGGKTVALKTVGLAALMTRAAIPFPAEDGSSCGFFDTISTDVGDDQSLTKNLSTFSAHVTNLSRILQAASPTSLVLLDEVAGGTDPEEGAALACAMVDALCRSGATLVLTTHYEALKAMATRDERLMNAAVGFDVAAMMPTFELRVGVPGASSALAVAARFGIPKSVIEFAKQVLPEQSRAFDEIVRELDEQRQELAVAKGNAQDERRALTIELATVARMKKDLASRGRKAIDDDSRRIVELLRTARKELKQARKSMRDAQTTQDLEQQRQRIDAAERALPDPNELPFDGPPAENVSRGNRVYVPQLRGEATVIDGPTRGKVRVEAGALKLWVKVADLGAAKRKTPAKPRVLPTTKQAPPPAPSKPETRSSDNTVDLRGLRVDDALSLAESFLDRVYGAGRRTAYIVHGEGTGALREAVRELLGRSRQYVSSFRAGDNDEGGDRLTVVTLQ